MSGAVSRLPLETSGFAPSTRKNSVWSTSGTAKRPGDPNIWDWATILGSWSTLVAEKRQRVPRLFWNVGPYRIEPRSWALGFPR